MFVFVLEAAGSDPAAVAVDLCECMDQAFFFFGKSRSGVGDRAGYLREQGEWAQ